MKEDTLVTIVAFALAVVLCCFVGWWLNVYQCDARWKDSGLNYRYELGAGCKIQRRDGTWVPASTIRELQP